MTEPVAVRFGALNAPGRRIYRSGLRWLCDEGQMCQEGAALAYCSVRFTALQGQKEATPPFEDEKRDLRVVFSSPVAGRVFYKDLQALGGFFDYDAGIEWRAEDTVGRIAATEDAPNLPASLDALRRGLAGRRVNELAEDRSGALSGWHERSRSFTVDSDARMGTLLALSVCDIEGVIKGDRFTFDEVFEGIVGPAQVVFVADRPLVPSARVLAEQVRRTEAERAAILQDFGASLAAGPVLANGDDWLFGGALMRTLCASPATESYTVLTREGLRSSGPADAILLTLLAEESPMLRHRKLGYSICVHGYRMRESGAAMRAWLRAHFEPVRRSPAEMQSDYRALIDAVRAQRPATRFIICNLPALAGKEEIYAYKPFTPPLATQIGSVRAKDLNLMLLDLARERDIDILDFEGVVGDLGGMVNTPDGIHPNRALEKELRGELLRILQARRVPGFQPAAAQLSANSTASALSSSGVEGRVSAGSSLR